MLSSAFGCDTSVDGGALVLQPDTAVATKSKNAGHFIRRPIVMLADCFDPAFTTLISIYCLMLMIVGRSAF
jgi:hypothetical protein